MIQKHIDKLEQEIKDNLEMIELLDSKRAEHVKNSSEYRAYLNSKEWQETRQRIFRRDRFTCVMCGANKNLHVHHITYENLGAEKDADLVTLCESCHAAVHDEVFSDPFYHLKRAEYIFSRWVNEEAGSRQRYAEAICPYFDEIRADLKKVLGEKNKSNYNFSDVTNDD